MVIALEALAAKVRWCVDRRNRLPGKAVRRMAASHRVSDKLEIDAVRLRGLPGIGDRSH
jgi:hypothetical protein